MDGLLGISEVLFFVPNVQEAKVWYIGLFGKQPLFDDENYCAFEVAGTTVGVHPVDDKTSSGVAGQVAYWHVADIHQAIARFESHGCRLFRGPILGVDKVWVCQLTDPFGNAWGLLQRLQ